MVKQREISRRGFLAGASAVAIVAAFPASATIPAAAAKRTVLEWGGEGGYLYRTVLEWGGDGLDWGERYNALGYAANQRRFELMRYAFSVPGKEITRVWVDELDHEITRVWGAENG